MILHHPSPRSSVPQPLLRRALDRLGIDRVVLSIHQASFPASDDDVGHGTPYGSGGAALLELAAALGFTGIALGPAGITSRDNPSPYDGSALSRNPLHIALAPLCGPAWGEILDERLLAAAVAARPATDRVAYGHAWETQRRLLAAAASALREHPCAGAGREAVRERVEAFRIAQPWLEEEARYEATAAAVGHDDWRHWPVDAPHDPDAAASFALAQVIVHAQHASFHQRVRRHGLALYGDLPIGLGHRDRLLRRDLFLPRYALGAPPSRTNPDGQPWGYPLLDPDLLGPGGAARDFVRLRFDKLLVEHDGLRIDHPHGWVCPWVYRADDPDPLAAVQRGTRLHESPALPGDSGEHSALARLARVRADQLDLDRPRHDDAWVRSLEPAQIDRYADSFDLLIERAVAAGTATGELLIEVLSTCPRPLAAVLARHQLGRFRVTQKARVDLADDVYRGDNARPEDWIMAGNHDTAPLRLVVERWLGTAEAERRAGYLAGRLTPPSPPGGRTAAAAAMAARLERDPDAMVQAMLAELFLGPARNVQIFWVDLFGTRDVYNRPGVVDPGNWSLRLPSDFRDSYSRAVNRGDAPDLPAAIATALRARGLDHDDDGRALVTQLGSTERSDIGERANDH
jgi:4-alpha-glucanotransferase